jgi:hypothetical protein
MSLQRVISTIPFILHDDTNHGSLLWVQKYGEFGISEGGKGRWTGGITPSNARYLIDVG